MLSSFLLSFVSLVAAGLALYAITNDLYDNEVELACIGLLVPLYGLYRGIRRGLE